MEVVVAVVRVEVMEVGVVAEVMVMKIVMTAVRGSALLGTTLITDHVTATVCDGVIVMLGRWLRRAWCGRTDEGDGGGGSGDGGCGTYWVAQLDTTLTSGHAAGRAQRRPRRGAKG